MPPSHTIQSPDGVLELTVCPDAGGCITSFAKTIHGNTVDVFRRYDDSLPLIAGNSSCFPMTPVSNRISNGRLSFEGEILTFAPCFGEEPNYLHGDGWTSAWAVKDVGPNHAVLTLLVPRNSLTPYVYEAEQRFSLFDGGLNMDIAVTNRGGRRLPFGIGHHPYFPRTGATVLKANLPEVWLCDELMHPTSLVPVPPKWNFARGVRLADPGLGPPEQGFHKRDLIDNCFTGWDQHAEIVQPDLGYSLKIIAEPVFQHFVIYNPTLDRDFFVAEAVTNIIDAFNLYARGVPDTGTIILEPGQTLQGRTRFELHPL
jgi:aldose 1-epimerase